MLLCPDRLTPAYKVLIFTREAGTLLGPLRKSDEYSGSHIRVLISRGLCLQISIRPEAKTGISMWSMSPLNLQEHGALGLDKCTTQSALTMDWNVPVADAQSIQGTSPTCHHR